MDEKRVGVSLCLVRFLTFLSAVGGNPVGLQNLLCTTCGGYYVLFVPQNGVPYI